MSQSKLVLVTGATGNQGGACVDALLSRGHRVRALTRNSDSPAAKRLRDRGVEIAVGDFTDRDSLARAVRGVDAVYAMSTPYELGAFANSPSYLNVIKLDEERFTDPKKCEYFFSEEHSITK